MSRTSHSRSRSRFGCRLGFTLIELLVVIAIIGILSGVVLVSTQSSAVRAKKASALTTAASILPELAACAEDGGSGKTGGAPTASTTPVCCTNATCGTAFAGHTVTWPDISKTNWTYDAPTGLLSDGTYQYTLTYSGDTITCSVASSGCN